MEESSLQNIEKILKTWALSINESTKEIISSALNNHPHNATQNSQALLDDIRDRQSRVITAIQEAHNRQLELLRTAISEERKEFSRAQLIFEQTLRTKYEHAIEALRETIQAELDSRMIRTLKNLENYAKIEGERAKHTQEFEIEVEQRLTNRLNLIVTDLRKSWEEEEISRIKQAEEKIRNNYHIVLEHMEAQLRMALTLQDDADHKWLEELDSRNKKQLESIKMFEEKCRRLYETRLIEYAEKTNAQIAHYEEKLLEVGSALASEKNQYENKLRRIKLACSRWKLAYQSEIHHRYREMTNVLDEKYTQEINELLLEVKELKSTLVDTQKLVERKEKEILKFHEMSSNEKSVNLPQTKSLRGELLQRFEELKIPFNERVDILVNLLDSSATTPELLSVYEGISTKLTARIPIAQALNRKQFIEYKLKLASRATGDSNQLNASEKADLIAELTEVKLNLDKLMKQYEKSFNESYMISNSLSDGIGVQVLNSQQQSVVNKLNPTIKRF